eukprot:2782914-Prymnesium_polylepis.1
MQPDFWRAPHRSIIAALLAAFRNRLYVPQCAPVRPPRCRHAACDRTGISYCACCRLYVAGSMLPFRRLGRMCGPQRDGMDILGHGRVAAHKVRCIHAMSQRGPHGVGDRCGISLGQDGGGALSAP